MARRLPRAAALVLAALTFTLPSALILPAGAEPVVASPCTPDPTALAPLEESCAPIRPGARSNACTLNFVVTDGTHLYIGAAGHCVGALGHRLRVDGFDGEVGTAVFKGGVSPGSVTDSAFYRIDSEDRDLVDPTLSRFAGPKPGPTGANVRVPLPGDTVVHYGHGASAGTMEETRGRVGTVVLSPVGLRTIREFVFVSNVDGGDSGSPAALATGEAAGIVTKAGPLLGYPPTLVFAEPMTVVLSELAKTLAKPVSVVNGRALITP